MTMFYNAFNRVEEGGGGGSTVPDQYLPIDICCTYPEYAGATVNVYLTRTDAPRIKVSTLTLSTTATSGVYHTIDMFYAPGLCSYEFQIDGQECYVPYRVRTLDKTHPVTLYVFPTLYGIWDAASSAASPGSDQRLVYYNTAHANSENTPAWEAPSGADQTEAVPQYGFIGYLGVGATSSRYTAPTGYTPGSAREEEDSILEHSYCGIGILGAESPAGVVKYFTCNIVMSSNNKSYDSMLNADPALDSPLSPNGSASNSHIVSVLKDYRLHIVGFDVSGKAHKLATGVIASDMYGMCYTGVIALPSSSGGVIAHMQIAIPDNTVAYDHYAVYIESDSNTKFASHGYIFDAQLYVDEPYVTSMLPGVYGATAKPVQCVGSVLYGVCSSTDEFTNTDTTSSAKDMRYFNTQIGYGQLVGFRTVVSGITNMRSLHLTGHEAYIRRTYVGDSSPSNTKNTLDTSAVISIYWPANKQINTVFALSTSSTDVGYEQHTFTENEVISAGLSTLTTRNVSVVPITDNTHIVQLGWHPNNAGSAIGTFSHTRLYGYRYLASPEAMELT